MEYRPPNGTGERYNAKFVRVGDALHVTEAGDTRTQHSELAVQDGILGEVMRLYKENPDDVDGGMIAVAPDMQMISVGGFSDTLSLPVTDAARARTEEVFKEQTPDYDIFTS